VLPLPSSFFKVLPLSQKCNCNRFRFHTRAPCFMKNASASGSSKNQMLPSLLPLLASFFKVLLLPQKFNRFYIPNNTAVIVFLAVLQCFHWFHCVWSQLIFSMQCFTEQTNCPFCACVGDSQLHRNCAFIIIFNDYYLYLPYAQVSAQAWINYTTGLYSRSKLE